jgi:hypothetical protein
MYRTEPARELFSTRRLNRLAPLYFLSKKNGKTKIKSSLKVISKKLCSNFYFHVF